MIQVFKYPEIVGARVMSVPVTTITIDQIKARIKQRAESESLSPALHPAEAEGFASGLISFYGLAAVNRAIAVHDAGQDVDAAVMDAANTFNSLPAERALRLNFEGATRDDLLRHLEACCGLERALCEDILADLEEQIFSIVRKGETVMIGTHFSIEPIADGGYRL